MTTDLIETVRKMRTYLPLDPAFVDEVREITGRDTLATRETIPLILRWLGHPGACSTAEQDRAAGIALDRFHGILGTPSLLAAVSLARVALAFGSQFVVNTLHPTASRTVLDTDLAFWPTTAPRALTRPLLVRALPGKGTGCLWADITAMILLPEDTGVGMVLCQRKDGSLIHDAIPMEWSAEDDPRSVDEVLRASLGGLDASGRIQSAQVLRWLVTFGLFLEAESQSGHRVTEVRAEAGTLPDGRPPRKGQGFTVRHIRISDEALATPPRRTGDAARGAQPHPNGLRAEEVTVRGFLRRQVCGKGRTERRVVFVAPFTRTQWVSQEKEVRVR